MQLLMQILVNSDPIVITGSSQLSNIAENNSDENTLIIHDPIIANIYLQEFEKDGVNYRLVDASPVVFLEV